MKTLRHPIALASLAAVLAGSGCVTAREQVNPDDHHVPEQIVEEYPEAYETLTPYGDWVYVSGYGHVWRPYSHVVGHDFYPYATGGQWVYSDAGWIFRSQWEWGVVPFHYGRWFHASNYGWVWLPGRVWAPSWVYWRHGGGYIGWAPIGPPGYYAGSYGAWCFVERDRFRYAWVGRYRVEPHRARVAYHRATPIGTGRSGGPSPRWFADARSVHPELRGPRGRVHGADGVRSGTARGPVDRAGTSRGGARDRRDPDYTPRGEPRSGPRDRDSAPPGEPRGGSRDRADRGNAPAGEPRGGPSGRADRDRAPPGELRGGQRDRYVPPDSRPSPRDRTPRSSGRDDGSDLNDFRPPAGSGHSDGWSVPQGTDWGDDALRSDRRSRWYGSGVAGPGERGAPRAWERDAGGWERGDAAQPVPADRGQPRPWESGAGGWSGLDRSDRSVPRGDSGASRSWREARDRGTSSYRPPESPRPESDRWGRPADRSPGADHEPRVRSAPAGPPADRSPSVGYEPRVRSAPPARSAPVYRAPPSSSQPRTRSAPPGRSSSSGGGQRSTPPRSESRRAR